MTIETHPIYIKSNICSCQKFTTQPCGILNEICRSRVRTFGRPSPPISWSLANPNPTSFAVHSLACRWPEIPRSFHPNFERPPLKLHWKVPLRLFPCAGFCIDRPGCRFCVCFVHTYHFHHFHAGKCYLSDCRSDLALIWRATISHGCLRVYTRTTIMEISSGSFQLQSNKGAIIHADRERVWCVIGSGRESSTIRPAHNTLACSSLANTNRGKRQSPGRSKARKSGDSGW